MIQISGARRRLFGATLFALVTAGIACASWPLPLMAKAVSIPAEVPDQFQLFRAEDFPPALLLPSPPASGSAIEVRELADLHKLIASASKDRLEQAHWDAVHEDPSIFDATLGISLKALPQTWALLRLVQNEGDTAADLSKDFYNRIRPYAVDPSLPNCEADPAKPRKPGKKPGRSYPSGHSTLGYSVGFALAALAPDRAPAVLARATDYALSRQYCGQHFPSDTEASHVLGTLVADRLLARPEMASRIAAARAELTAALHRTAN
jgi:acid phosphatase (class A)